MEIIKFPEPLEFDWDESNEAKIFTKHNVRKGEVEQAFFNFHLLHFDERHSSVERRYHLLGTSDTARILFIAFTMRGHKIRVISARAANRKERKVYAEEAKKNSSI